MTSSAYPAANPGSTAAPPVASPGGNSQGVLAGAVLLILSLAAVWTINRQFEAYLAELDAASLRQSEETLEALVNQHRIRLLTDVQVLVEDTRIRTTAMTTGFDEGTIKDILDDLKKSANVNVLAVLDEKGKVRAITGAEGLRQIDLSGSPVIRAAQEKPASYFWTLPEQVLIIGVAPIRAGDRVSALLLMGTTLGTQELTGVERSLGVFGAVFSGDRPIATSSNDARLLEVFKSARTTGDVGPRVVRGFPNT